MRFRYEQGNIFSFLSKLLAFLPLLGLFFSSTNLVRANYIDSFDLHQLNPGLVYVEDSLTPDIVMSNESVSFQLTISNPNDQSITLDDSTNIVFNSPDGNTYSSIIHGSKILHANTETRISFLPINLNDYSSEEVVAVTINIFGYDADSSPIQQVLVLHDVLTIEPNMDIFTEVIGSLQPIEPSRQSMIVYWVRIINTSDCAINLDSRSEIVLTTEDQWVHRTPLLNQITIQPGEEKRVDFSSYSDPENGYIYNWINNDVPDGSYYPRFRLIGTNNCTGADVFNQFTSADFLTISPVIWPLSSTGKISQHPILMTQSGAVTEINLGQGIENEDPYQILVGVQVESRCDRLGCQPLPPTSYHLDNPYFYIWNSDYRTTRLLIYPDETMLSHEYWGVNLSVIQMTVLPETGVGIWKGYGDRVEVYLAEMDGAVEHQSITTNNTFVISGDSIDVSISVANNYPYSFRDINKPHYPGNQDGALVIQPQSHLRLLQGGANVSNKFSYSLINSNFSIPYDTSQEINYSLQVGADAPLGKVEIAASTTAVGTYDAYFEEKFVENPHHDPFDGNYTAQFIGETPSETQIESLPIVIVEQIPLALDIQSNGQAIGINKPVFDVTLNNSSNHFFTITPSTEAYLPVEAVDSLILQTVENDKLDFYPYGPIAQSFVPPVSFLLNQIKTQVVPTTSDPELLFSTNPEIFTLELIKANKDGSLSDLVLDKAVFILQGTSPGYMHDVIFEFDNILLEGGEVYYVLMRQTANSLVAGSMFEDGWANDESYPDGHGYTSTNHGNRMIWEMTGLDFAFQFHGTKLFYQCEIESTETIVLNPGESTNLTFSILDDLSKVVDDSLAPQIIVVGEVDIDDEIISYNQTISNDQLFLTLDSNPPSAQIRKLPIRTAPQTILIWSGQDDNTGVLDYDVQVQIDGEGWTDWLQAEESTSATYPSELGHTYSFRVRARDRSLNVGEWCEPTSTEVGEWLSPIVSESNPVDGAINVSIETNIMITFDQYVSVSPGWYSLSCSDSQSLPATVTDMNPSYFLEPMDSLGYFEVCTVTVDAKKVNPELSEDFIFSFTTEYDPLASPVAQDDHYETMEENTIQILAEDGVLANDYDVNGDQLTAVLVEGISSAEGILHFNSEGEFTFTPQIDFFGDVTFTYKVNDGFSYSNIATVTITVHNVNDPPKLITGGTYRTSEDTTLQVPSPGSLAYAHDPDDDVLTAHLVEGPPAEQGTLYLNPNGSFDFVPTNDFHGSVVFTLMAYDGEYFSGIAEAKITVNPVNDRPLAENDSYSTDEDTPLVVPSPGILENDTDIEGDSLTAVLVDGPNANEGVLDLMEDGSYIFTPFPDFYGTAVFTYKANDGHYHSNIATVTITVNPVNDQPVALDDSYETDEDTTLNVPAPGVLSNDIDVDGDSLTAILVEGLSADEGLLDLYENGSILFTPSPDFNGTVTFTYKVEDGISESAPATTTISVNPVNDAPLALNDFYIIDEDSTLIVSDLGVLTNDWDQEGDLLTAVLIEGPSIEEGILTLNPQGSFTFIPAPNFHGNVFFTYVAFDGDLESNIAVVDITVVPVNDSPIANDDFYNTDEDVSLIVSAPGVLTNDTDIDEDALNAVLVSGPTHGTLLLDADGSFIFTPDPDYFGSDEFTYQAFDGDLNSNYATVTLIVDPVNHPPIAVADNFESSQNVTLRVDAPGVLANDIDPDNDSLTAMLVEDIDAEHGTIILNSDGSFDFIPKPYYFGKANFTYLASDGQENSEAVTVTIFVHQIFWMHFLPLLLR